jgi:FkbM family methyltransferase
MQKIIREKKVYIFSGGQTGKLVADFLINNLKIKPHLIIDNFKKGKYKNIKFTSEKKIFKNDDICIVGLYNNYLSMIDIQEKLKKKFKKVFNIIEFKNCFDKFQLDYWLTKKSKRLLLLKKEKIFNKFFSDRESKQLLLRILNFRLTGQKKFDIKPEKNIYFSFKKKFPKTLEVLDCGSYRGEFIDKLYKNKFDIKKAICIEPDKKNFKYLKKKFKKKDNIKLINAVVGITGKDIGFDFKGGDNGRIDNLKKTKIKCYDLKNLYNTNINIIKLDIEGFENFFLKSINKLILTKKPIILISVYHYNLDIVSNIKLMRKYKSYYDFYMRTHEFNTFGTIIYCIPKKII